MDRSKNSFNDFMRKYGIYIFFGVCLVLCLLRAVKGFCWTDESFYYSTADRFYRGDLPIKEEWYRTQMSSLICLPFYAAFVLITGSNAGIILYFRLLYLILSFITAIVCYRVIRKDYPTAVSACTAFLIIFYAHLNNTTFSYYMLSLDFLILAVMLIYDYKNKRSAAELIAAGVMLALCILSMPALVVSVFAVIIAMLLTLIAGAAFRKNGKISSAVRQMELPSLLLYVGIGAAASAAVFAIYLLSRVSVSEIISALPYIMVDNEHDFTYGYLIRKFIHAISDVYGRSAYVGYFMILLTFLFGKYLRKCPAADFIEIADGILFVIYAVKSYGHTGYIQTAFLLAALPLYFMTEKKNHRLFWCMLVPGVLMAATYCFSSSDFLYVLSIGYFVSAVACICFACDYLKEKAAYIRGPEWDDKGGETDAKRVPDSKTTLASKRVAMLAGLVTVLMIIYTCCVTFALRMVNVYRDAPIGKLDTKIGQGVAAGLYTTKEHAQMYDNVYSDIETYLNEDSDIVSGRTNIMFSKILPWGYMACDLDCAYPTTWRATAYNADQLEAYYEMNPDNEPDVIVVLDEEYGSYDACGDVEDDHNPNLDEMNDYWKDYIADNNMKEIKILSGKMYVK